MMLITGGTGRLGRALRRVFPDAWAPGRAELDLLDAAGMAAHIRRRRPRVVVHAAAFTDVRRAEHETALCWATNVHGTEVLVEALHAEVPDAYLVYVSTACVFQGDRGRYTEADVPHPKNFYGLSKLVAEFVARRLATHLIVRTNFVEREPWPYPRAFADRFGTYLYAHDVAQALRDIIGQRLTGLVHVAGDRRLSMLELAQLTTPSVGAMTIADVPASLPLTMDMTLESARIAPYRLTLTDDRPLAAHA